MRVGSGSTWEKIRLGVPEGDARFSPVGGKAEKSSDLSQPEGLGNVYLTLFQKLETLTTISYLLIMNL